MDRTGPRRGGAAVAGAAVLAVALTGCGRGTDRALAGRDAPEVLAAGPLLTEAPEPTAGAHPAPASPRVAAVSRPATPRAATAEAEQKAEARKGSARPLRRTGAARTEAVPRVAPASTLAMPAPGPRVYDMAGTTSLGAPPTTMSLAVADVPDRPAAQTWTFEARTAAGTGVIEGLTLERGAGGVRLAGYHLELTRGISVTFDFTSAKPVLLFPDRPRAGRPWEWTLVSDDGCATVRTTGVLVAPSDAGAGHLRVTSDLVSTGRPACVAVDLHRVQEVWHAPGGALPTRLDSDLDGTIAGVPIEARTTATLRRPG